MPYNNIPPEFRPYDLSEGPLNTMGQPVLGGEAASTRADRLYAEKQNQQHWYQTLGIATDKNTETLFDGVVDSFTSGGNFAHDILSSYRRAYENPVDPNFNAQDWIRKNAQKYNIDVQYLPAFGGVASEGEAQALLSDINSRQQAQKRLQRMGIAGQLTSGLIAGMFDVDTLLSAGIGLAGKTGIMATRMGRIMAGTAIGTISATAGAAASPENDWQNVAVAALLSAGLSSIGKDGKIDTLHQDINSGIHKGLDDLDEAIKRPVPDDISPTQAVERPAFAPDPVDVPDLSSTAKTESAGSGRPPANIDASEVSLDLPDDVWEEGRRSSDSGSLGARQLSQAQAKFAPPPPTIQNVIDRADQYLRANDLDNRYYYDFYNDESKVASAASTGMRKTVDALGAVGLIADFDKMYKTGSSVAKMFAHEFLSDGSGRLTNVRAAVHLRDDWRDLLRNEWYPSLQDGWHSYAKKRGMSEWTLLNNPRKYLATRAEFDKRVVLAQEDLRINGRYDPNGDPDVILAANGVDNWGKLDVKIGKGNGSTTAIPGYEEMKEQPGYFPRKVTSAKQAAVIRDSLHNPEKYWSKGRAVGYKDIEQMWTEFYSNGGLNMKDARIVAKAIMDKSTHSDRGADMNLYGLLQGDGKTLLENALKAQDMTQSEVDRVIRSLVRDANTRGLSGHVRSRLDGDVRFVSSNGLKVIDFLDTDIENILTYRSANTAGRAAAAAKGIRTQDDANNIIEAILEQQQRNVNNTISINDALSAPNKLKGLQSYTNDLLDKDRKVTREYLNGIMSHFMGGARITDDTAALVTRMKRSTILSTMNGLGLTQLAETGALMGAVGWREFVRQLPAAMRSDIANPRSALIQELHSMGKLIPEERLYNPRYMADLDMSLHAKGELAHMFDMLTGKGLQVQGIISGMNKVRYAQQKMAMLTTIDRLMQAISGKVPDAISSARLAQIGIDPKMIEELKKIQKHITWDGINVKQLNMHLWENQELADDFGRAMGIATDQLVQKARLGESNSFFAGNGVASMFGQFLSYPLTAITKQAARNAYAGDAETMYQLLYGFIFAGMVGMSKAVIAGRYEELNPVDFAKQGFVQANITGWVPLISDPLMSLLGAKNLKFNNYGDVIRTPPPVDVLNRTLKAPASIAGIISGDVSKENLRNLRYLPLIGNWYGMTALTNRL